MEHTREFIKQNELSKGTILQLYNSSNSVKLLKMVEKIADSLNIEIPTKNTLDLIIRDINFRKYIIDNNKIKINEALKLLFENEDYLYNRYHIATKLFYQIIPFDIIIELYNNEGLIDSPNIRKYKTKLLEKFIEENINIDNIDIDRIMSDVYDEYKKIIKEGDPLSENLLLEQLDFCIENNDTNFYDNCLNDILNFIKKNYVEIYKDLDETKYSKELQKVKKINNIMNSNISNEEKIKKIASLKLSNE